MKKNKQQETDILNAVKDGLVDLNYFRKDKPAFYDLLNWGIEVEDGIILNKDGSLMSGWFYFGQDLSVMGVVERNYVSQILNSALIKLGNGWSLHQDSIRIESKEYPSEDKNHFRGFADTLIESERRKQFKRKGNFYETIYAFILTWQAPSMFEGKLKDSMFEIEGEDEKPKINYLENAIDYFKRTSDEVVDMLSNVLDLQRMSLTPFQDNYGQIRYFSDLVQYLCFSLDGVSHPMLYTQNYIDSMLATDMRTAITPIIKDKYVQVITIKNFPPATFPNILQDLEELDFEYRWNTRFIFLDKLSAKNKLEKIRKQWSGKVTGLFAQLFPSMASNKVDRHSLDMLDQSEIALSDLESDYIAYGYYTSTIIIRDSDLTNLELKAREVIKVLNINGFQGFVETINNIEAFLGSLGGNTVANIRKPLINTLNLANLLPLSSVYCGEEQAPCPFYEKNSPPLLYAVTDGSTPFRFNLHIGDLGHTLMFGPTGAGKSTILAFIAAQFLRYKNSKVFAFDKGNSMEPLALGVGGNHFNILGDNSTLNFAPLETIRNPNELIWAVSWIEDLLKLNGIVVTPNHRNKILEALKRMAAKDGGELTLTNLKIEIQDMELKEALSSYTVDGDIGELLDSANNGLENSYFTVFELEELMNKNDRIKISVLLYLFHWVERQLDGSPSLMILDEAWVMLGNPVFREKIREWLKVLRKANCAVILATQSLSDAKKSGILDVLVESCPTKIFLANKNSEESEIKDLYLNMGCTETEIGIIKNMLPKRQYFIKGAGKRRVDFGLGDLALAFVGNSDKDSLKTIRELHKRYGEDWGIYWLKNKGIDYKDYL